MAYDDGHWSETSNLAGEAATPENPSDEAGQDLSLFKTLALIQTNRSRVTESAVNLVLKFDQQKLAGKAAEARLLIGEALLATGDRSRAQQLLVEAIRFFEPRENFESLWRAHALAARAAADPREAAGHRAQAEAALTQLKMSWPAESMNGYMRRQAIRQLSTEMRS